MNQTAEQIKQQISMLDVFNQYGFEIKRGEFILCPFHPEDTPSLKSYANGTRWKCFGCGAGGTVIDFVMRLYNINFFQALIRINCDFGLNLIENPSNFRNIQKLKEERALKEAKKRDWENRYKRLWSRFVMIDKFLINNQPTEKTGGDFGALIGEHDRIWSLIKEMEYQANRR